MLNRRNRVVQRQLRTLFNLGIIGELTDGQLLERFTTQTGEASELAFAALVERHGKLVLGVCRNALRDPDDIQDAFQATFLVLVEKARSLWVRDSLGPWLHRVAYRVSSRARASRARRREHERRVAETRPIAYSGESNGDDLAVVVHQEIDRLPERYRVPLVLCDLEGRTHVQAARHLGWPVGTIKSRLGRARDLLRDRLSRRGLGLPAGVVIWAVRSTSAEAVSLGPLAELTTRSAIVVVTGKASATAYISAHVALLKQEVLKTMFLTKLKVISVALLVAGALVTVTAGVVAQQGPGSRPATREAQPGELARAASRDGSGIDSKPAPAYIQRSRKMMITRLEEETAKARETLVRMSLNARSRDDSAIARARKTTQGLDNLLARIDDVLVNAIEMHPTIFDLSAEASRLAVGSQPVAEQPAPKNDEANRSSSVGIPDEADLEHAKDKAEWSERMYKKGYVSKTTADLERSRYESTKQIRLGNRELATSILLEAALARAKEKAEWADGMHKKGYATKHQLETASKDYEDLKRDIAHALDRIHWAESSFKKGYISQENLDFAYRDYEKLTARQSSERPAIKKP